MYEKAYWCRYKLGFQALGSTAVREARGENVVQDAIGMLRVCLVFKFSSECKRLSF